MAARKGNKWQSRVRGPDKYHRYSFDTREEAEAWESHARLQLSLHRPIIPPTSQGTSGTLRSFVDAHWDAMWGASKSPQSQRRLVESVVSDLGPESPLGSIDTPAVLAWMSELREVRKNSDKTCNRKLSALSVILKLAKELSLIETLPRLKRYKERVGRVRWLTPSEEKRLLSWGNLKAPEAFSRRVLFMLYTGARDGEVRNLKWQDVDLKGKRVTFWETKGGSPRTLMLPAGALEALKWCNDQGFEKPFPMSYRTFHEYWTAMRLSVFPNEPENVMVPYTLRHTCCSRLVQGGVDIRRVKDWMGHSSINTTMRYAHLAPDSLDVCADVLDAG